MNYALVIVAGGVGGFAGTRIAFWWQRRIDARSMVEMRDDMIEAALQHMLDEERRRIE